MSALGLVRLDTYPTQKIIGDKTYYLLFQIISFDTEQLKQRKEQLRREYCTEGYTPNYWETDEKNNVHNLYGVDQNV